MLVGGCLQPFVNDVGSGAVFQQGFPLFFVSLTFGVFFCADVEQLNIVYCNIPL